MGQGSIQEQIRNMKMQHLEDKMCDRAAFKSRLEI